MADTTDNDLNRRLGLEAIERPQPSDNLGMAWGSDAVAEVLRQLRIEFVALVPGSSYRCLHDSLVNYLGNERPKVLLTLHEEHALAIAHGYAKVTEQPMAVALHSNVGLMHASMAIFNAWCARMPVLVLGATGPVDAVRRRPWIDWIHTARDQGALVRPFIKWDDQPASAQAAVEAMIAHSKSCGVRRGVQPTSVFRLKCRSKDLMRISHFLICRVSGVTNESIRARNQ